MPFKKEVVEKFVANFDNGLKDENQTAEFLSSYHPDVQWFDHAFHIQRVGHDAIMGLNKTFLHCNQPFSNTIKAIHETPTGAVLEQVWRGTCKNSIVRPDGQVAVEGSGKQFEAHVCMILNIDDEGKITRIDEYYNKRWDLGIHEDAYVVMKGGLVRTT